MQEVHTRKGQIVRGFIILIKETDPLKNCDLIFCANRLYVLQRLPVNDLSKQSGFKFYTGCLLNFLNP